MIHFNFYGQCRQSMRLGKVFLIAISMLLLLLASGCQTAAGPATDISSPADATAAPEAEAASARIEEDMGIEIIAIRTTAAGNMLDFRFKVLDSEKAMPFFKKELKPNLIDEASGKVLAVPVPAKGGPMRPTSRDPRVGITYFMLFGNPGHFVKVGNQVTIVVGDLRVENLTVE